MYCLLWFDVAEAGGGGDGGGNCDDGGCVR
jgi:hypothetical protein